MFLPGWTNSEERWWLTYRRNGADTTINSLLGRRSMPCRWHCGCASSREQRLWLGGLHPCLWLRDRNPITLSMLVWIQPENWAGNQWYQKVFGSETIPWNGESYRQMDHLGHTPVYGLPNEPSAPKNLWCPVIRRWVSMGRCSLVESSHGLLLEIKALSTPCPS